jgi:hypothetical protein
MVWGNEGAEGQGRKREAEEKLGIRKDKEEGESKEKKAERAKEEEKKGGKRKEKYFWQYFFLPVTIKWFYITKLLFRNPITL